jgi:DHA2 family multidrug resistance protein-like MFS transporter
MADRGGQSEPQYAKVIAITLILVAAVANLNLSGANVALPDIGESFNASQTALNLIAVGVSLGLAASVLWLGALGRPLLPPRGRGGNARGLSRPEQRR